LTWGVNWEPISPGFSQEKPEIKEEEEEEEEEEGKERKNRWKNKTVRKRKIFSCLVSLFHNRLPT